MKTSEIMSTPVVFTQPDIKLAQLKDMLARKGIHAVPVLEDDGEIAGIVSSSDIVASHDESMTVKDVMSKRVHVVAPHGGVQDAAKTMVKHHVHHLVVMDDGKVVGMLSALDVVKVFSES